ncbi:protein CrcB [Oceanicola sp. 22II-s10i]|uniref:fluoride efflux transporter CrcB n=1 Tax=Oceanicola sp. 22II-s10i TaxID=1317116 RepID=UPI000B5248D9|nr:fluoride efflux transporter CrcB [Oceanicola sp. 22II-s10i]OWU84012.1 protein CrcB [Oceanicola sp. 22II-s10i]
MFTTVIQVALGGALGAALRYLSGVGIARMFGTGGFPLGVIFVNILGSGIMGALVVVFAHKGLTYLNPLVMTGVLGGFTTFSAFSLEAFTLWERGATGQAAVYVGASVILSLAALVAGAHIARTALA